MKFSINTVRGAKLRRGKLSGFKRLPDLVLETPLLLMYTKGGSVPHITHEVLQLVTTEHQAAQLTLPTTYLMHEAVKEFKKGIPSFIGLPECLTYLCIQDPASKTPEGYNRRKDVSIWTHTGRAVLDSYRYMDVVEAFQPDIYEVLANGDTNAETSHKKINKVVESSRNMFEECLERHKASEILQGKSIVALIEGGYDVEARKKCASSFTDAPVDGFVISGLHSNGPDVEKIEADTIRPLIDAVTENLPEDKPRILRGPWSPRTLLNLVEMGIDVFDSSSTYLATQRFGAFVFEYEPVEIEREVKDETDAPIEISLKESQYQEDFSPLVKNCGCLVCVKHTRAYIYHLINNKELLATTLLMIHNLHHYMEFFKAIRQAISSNKKLILK